MTDEFEKSIPILPVANAAETAKFYKERLGFEIDVLWENPPYAVVSRGNASIEFGESRPEHVGGGVCYFVVENADTIYAEYKATGVEFVDKLENREYGNRDFRVKDNNGNLLIIGNSLPNQEELISSNSA